uniref:Uncharacterized protein n=1 Tax=Spongospora subterranea TaxID=70186 RepID=A0A0H5QJ04_9EUKA|eukprot:CRZ02100.1 hypothetical protein [Spongospora subterranea]
MRSLLGVDKQWRPLRASTYKILSFWATFVKRPESLHLCCVGNGPIDLYSCYHVCMFTLDNDFEANRCRQNYSSVDRTLVWFPLSKKVVAFEQDRQSSHAMYRTEEYEMLGTGTVTTEKRDALDDARTKSLKCKIFKVSLSSGKYSDKVAKRSRINSDGWKSPRMSKDTSKGITSAGMRNFLTKPTILAASRPDLEVTTVITRRVIC